MSDTREVKDCKHRFVRGQACTNCGVYCYKSEAMKTAKYSTPFHFNSKNYLRSMRSSSHVIV